MSRPVPEWITHTLVGAALAAPGVYYLHVAAHLGAIPDRVFFVCVGAIVLGCIVAAPAVVLTPLKALVGILAPLLPKVSFGAKDAP